MKGSTIPCGPPRLRAPDRTRAEQAASSARSPQAADTPPCVRRIDGDAAQGRREAEGPGSDSVPRVREAAPACSDSSCAMAIRETAGSLFPAHSAPHSEGNRRSSRGTKMFSSSAVAGRPLALKKSPAACANQQRGGVRVVAETYALPGKRGKAGEGKLKNVNRFYVEDSSRSDEFLRVMNEREATMKVLPYPPSLRSPGLACGS
eukprot:scaffold4383_cov390-Prasinococcus_capsulatus_cf.AAC.1